MDQISFIVGLGVVTTGIVLILLGAAISVLKKTTQETEWKGKNRHFVKVGLIIAGVGLIPLIYGIYSFLK